MRKITSLFEQKNKCFDKDSSLLLQQLFLHQRASLTRILPGEISVQNSFHILIHQSPTVIRFRSGRHQRHKSLESTKWSGISWHRTELCLSLLPHSNVSNVSLQQLWLINKPRILSPDAQEFPWKVLPKQTSLLPILTMRSQISQYLAFILKFQLLESSYIKCFDLHLKGKLKSVSHCSVKQKAWNPLVLKPFFWLKSTHECPLRIASSLTQTPALRAESGPSAVTVLNSPNLWRFVGGNTVSNFSNCGTEQRRRIN